MHENLIRIKAVSSALSDLDQEYVFVGGATVSLYATNIELGSEIRATDDVDIVVELASYGGYSKIDEKLRSLGFVNDVGSGVICRYKLQGIIVDVMPTQPEVIGFSNIWYPDGFTNAVTRELDRAGKIRIFSLPYFVASKWEAFKGRGKGDYLTSKDFEDLVYIWENADDYIEQILDGPEKVRSYLKEEFNTILHTDKFREGIYAHISGGYGGRDVNFIFLKIIESLK